MRPELLRHRHEPATSLETCVAEATVSRVYSSWYRTIVELRQQILGRFAPTPWANGGSPLSPRTHRSSTGASERW
jgi:hypothetical protein